MGSVVAFPKHQARTSAGLARANRSKVTSFTLLRFARSKIAGQRFGGMPRSRQLLTTGGSSPRAAATFVVPPKALMIPSSSMPSLYFTDREVVKPHVLSSDFVAGLATLSDMPRTLDAIAFRLLTLRAWRDLSQKDFCAEIDVGTNHYSPFENAKRRIPLEIATKLVERYGVTLDWIYLGDLRGMTGQMQAELRIAELKAKAA
jgi:hypothetical protein